MTRLTAKFHLRRIPARDGQAAAHDGDLAAGIAVQVRSLLTTFYPSPEAPGLEFLPQYYSNRNVNRILHKLKVCVIMAFWVLLRDPDGYSYHLAPWSRLKLEMQKKADKGATKGTAGAGAGTKTGTAGKSTAGAGKTAGPTKMVTTKGRPGKAK